MWKKYFANIPENKPEYVQLIIDKITKESKLKLNDIIGSANILFAMLIT